ncbi:Lipoxygenase 3 [Citrus sinensis]|uniref:Lipoxygenase 3 n=1 Tax=Citrus sinensis TaxID=2711 RepID=A0ACB8J7V8_CITSI|nr:Lipoxygenase 3 [Citrus sinensis]
MAANDGDEVANQKKKRKEKRSGDKFSWLRDDEFARQALAGVNPVTIEGLQAFPPVSNLDPEIYGPQESALKEEHIIGQLDGMPCNRKAYATRTIFFLNSLGPLKPIAIELSLPPSGPDQSACSSHPSTPLPIGFGSLPGPMSAPTMPGCTNSINSAHRQLSAMHPIYKLLDPHMRYTYGMEISASMFKSWRFDKEGLPADLIRRGMAVPDPTQPDGLKLLIEDYPYAADGLLIWSAIEDWHAALNFGQCPYGGYVPNRPPFDEKWVMFGYT